MEIKTGKRIAIVTVSLGIVVNMIAAWLASGRPPRPEGDPRAVLRASPP